MIKPFTLYRADHSQTAQNAEYPHKETINSLQDLLKTAQKDHIFSEMKDNHRATDNYISTDGIILDLDNTFSNDRDDWKTIDDIAEALPDVMFYYVQSRNYMKVKTRTNAKGVTTYEEPREKYHLYFPLSKKITDHEEISRLMLEAAGLYCYMDLGSAEPQHFFFGVPDAKGGEVEGTLTIDEYISTCGEELREIIARNLDEYEKNVKAGLYNRNKETERAISRLNKYIDRQTAPEEDEQAATDPGDWIDDAERDRQIKWLEKWAEENAVSLGKRYKVNTKAHPNALVICVTCPWEDDHSMNGAENESVIIIDAGGQLHYLCRHSHGIGLTWKDYRKKIEEDSGKAKQVQESADNDSTEQPNEPTLEELKEIYNQGTAAAHIHDFFANIEAEADKPAISTGFPSLDRILGGGIRTGLYIIGALSSLGKTTFMIQMADYIAKQGRDVLYFSLEQPEREIIAKSISRETYNAALIRTGSTRQAKSTIGILDGRRYKNYMQEEKRIILEATGQYKKYADKIRIIEGVGNIGAQEIEKKIKEHEIYTGNKPIVFIDYLQIMAPPIDGRRSYTDKQATDKNILELKRLSREYSIIAISSFNRDSYTEPVNLSSFKESGAIEYTSDYLIGLQYVGMDYQTDRNGKRESESTHAARVQKQVFEVQQDRGKRGQAQDIELKLLKGRIVTKDKMKLSFYPCFNLYQEEGTEQQTTLSTSYKAESKGGKYPLFEQMKASGQNTTATDGDISIF